MYPLELIANHSAQRSALLMDRLAWSRAGCFVVEGLLKHVEEKDCSDRCPGGCRGYRRSGSGRYMAVARAAAVLRHVSHHGAVCGVVATHLFS